MIYIATDYGILDPYSAILKSRILLLDPKAVILDITHNLIPFSIDFASWSLYLSFLHLPKPAIFCWIVDPGVGSERKSLICKLKDNFFIVPDNGIFTPFLLKYENKVKFFEILPLKLKDIYLKILSNKKIKFDYKISYTFHGRDIFAPAAALIHYKPSLLNKFTIPISNIVKTDFIKIPVVSSNEIQGKIIYIDHFGNLITNIQILPHWKKDNNIILNIFYKNQNLLTIKGLSKTFSDQSRNQFVFYTGSFDFLEIAINQGNLHQYFIQKLGETYLSNISISVIYTDG